MTLRTVRLQCFPYFDFLLIWSSQGSLRITEILYAVLQCWSIISERMESNKILFQHLFSEKTAILFLSYSSKVLFMQSTIESVNDKWLTQVIIPVIRYNNYGFCRFHFLSNGRYCLEFFHSEMHFDSISLNWLWYPLWQSKIITIQVKTCLIFGLNWITLTIPRSPYEFNIGTNNHELEDTEMAGLGLYYIVGILLQPVFLEWWRKDFEKDFHQRKRYFTFICTFL